MDGPVYRSIAAVFARVGNLTFGGGDPTMLVLRRELVERFRWMDHQQYSLVYGLARVTPGTNVLAFSAGAGWVLRGWRGALLAVLASCLPSAVIALVLAEFVQSGQSNAWVRAAMLGVNAAVVGLMAAGAWLLIRPHYKSGARTRSIVLAGIALLLAAPPLGWTPIPILAIALALGLLWKAPYAI
ncbi:MAG: chromate transporter [Bryobacteraceae bacterium]